ncbi:MAG: universal stress protein [Deltaproteobacteria bacterium]|nr:universal stress protein [Deltaproteobacteria bacterium]MDQ3299248.1 universal stress protein [Myxococcota bacterium]
MTAVSHVVVGYDFSHPGHAALQRGVAIASRAPSHVLHVLCVIDPRSPIPSIPSYDGVDAMYAARVQEMLAIEIQAELERAEIQSRVHFFVHARIAEHVADELLGLAREVGADLIVVGSHGLTGLERFLVGSTSEKIVRDAGCSVEIARVKQYPEVELPTTVENEPDLDHDHDHPYIPPHRYTYENHRVSLRPPEWPLV